MPFLTPGPKIFRMTPRYLNEYQITWTWQARFTSSFFASCFFATAGFWAVCHGQEPAGPQGTPGEPVEIVFELHAPGLAEDTTVFVTGSVPALGNWIPGAIKMNYRGEATWSYRIQAMAGRAIEYKYTLGTWQREGAQPNGEPLPNRIVRPHSGMTVTDRVDVWTTPRERRVVGQITGEVRYHRQLSAEGLLPRDVIVWLPPDYELDNARFPVLYMQDGQNIIDPNTSSFGVDWQVDETLTRLIASDKIPPMIVVGIYNTAERTKDYLPGEQGSRYARFLCEQLKPFIDRSYRTDPSRDATAICGSSAGGICAFHVTWTHPDIFSKAICMSPAFRYERPDGTASVDYLPEFSASARPTPTPFFYIDNGGVGVDERLQPGIDLMLAAMRQKGMEPGRNYVWQHFVDASHNEAAWAERLPAALESTGTCRR